MKILGLIPARGGSKGVPGKNIRLLAGKPLIEYTAERALASTYLTKVIVSTDDIEIAAICSKVGIEVPFIRPDSLAQDNTPTLPVVQHALQHLQGQGESYDAVCILQPTVPFRKAGFIDDAIEQFLSVESDSLISVLPVPTEFNPHWVFEQDAFGFLKIATGDQTIIPRRQELPRAYIRDGALYLTKSTVILNGSLYGEKIAHIENDPSFHVNIDTRIDWEKAEALAVRFNQQSCAE